MTDLRAQAFALLDEWKADEEAQAGYGSPARCQPQIITFLRDVLKRHIDYGDGVCDFCQHEAPCADEQGVYRALRLDLRTQTFESE